MSRRSTRKEKLFEPSAVFSAGDTLLPADVLEVEARMMGGRDELAPKLHRLWRGFFAAGEHPERLLAGSAGLVRAAFAPR